ncbi:MAG: NmrA family NAD(P)-binding protein [Flavipsychrobacter sp.]|nr:NmrA family NAD(P)-binding protein [Flavipsychrobacter sp.]
MKTTILVAGATGHLGGLIVHALLERGAVVRAIVREGSDYEKVQQLEHLGVQVITANLMHVGQVTKACEGVACVVSALQGLHDVILDIQSVLLDAAVAAGVSHFIPSDYASDFTKLPFGENRNFDLRREFHIRLDAAPIAATSILNGAFAELLSYNMPFFNTKDKTVGYLNDANWRVDFTTMANTAAFTAAAAMDASAPRVLRIAGFQISANEMASLAGDVLHEQFQLVRMGTTTELAAQNVRDRAAHPEGEAEVYSGWQRTQYLHSMFSVQLQPLDNDRYPGIKWTSAREVIAKH